MPISNVTPDSPISVTRVTLTSAQVLAIASTPVTIVPAPGAGNMVRPISATFKYTAGATPYTDHGGNLALITLGVGNWVAFASAGFWDQATSQVVVAPNPSITGKLAASALSGVGVVVQNSAANPTAGDGTMTVTVAYEVVTIA